MAELGTVAALYRYPVKSMLGERLDSAPFTERGVAGEHRRGVVVDERVDLAVGRRALQRGEDRGRQQHVAVMAKLGDERTTDEVQRDGIRERARHAVHDTKNVAAAPAASAPA